MHGMTLDTGTLALLGALVVALIVVLILLVRARNEAVAATASVIALEARVRSAEGERDRVLGQQQADQARFASDLARAQSEATEARARLLSEMEAERARIVAEVARAKESADAGRAAAMADVARLTQTRDELTAQITSLQSFGFYRPRYDFATSEAYQTRLEEIREAQKEMLRLKTAAVGDVEWTVNGSKVEGRKQIAQTLKLMLRAFNGECDAAVARVRYNNVQVMEARIRKAWETVNTLAQVQQCRVVPEYLDLKLQELFLAYEYQEKVYAEREEQRRIREQMREEELAQRELERAREDAEREERRYEEALAKARSEVERAVGAKQERLQEQIADLERRLAEAHERKERAIARAQLTRSGHVYVISNVGSFGEEVFKIGMTRRLDPMDRVRELGDASVPFEFDVHAIIYTEDAPGLENKLHRQFHWRRINRVNERKEFFRVSIDEIAAAVRAENAEIELVREAEARDYRKTLAMLAEEVARGGAPASDDDRRRLAYDRRSGPARSEAGLPRPDVPPVSAS